jgi:hypothetical protein
MATSIKLEDLEIKEASAVDHPAHLHEGWIVMKSEDLTEIPATDEESVTDTEGENNVELHVDSVSDESTVDDEETVVDEAADLAVEPVAASVAGPDITSVQKELADLRKELTETREAHEALTAQVDLEKATEAAHQWAILPELSPTEFAPVLQSLRTKAPEEMATVEKILSATATALKEAGTFKELGTDTASESDNAWGEIEGLANTLVTDGGADSMAKAISQVAAQRPDLYERYISEKGA